MKTTRKSGEYKMLSARNVLLLATLSIALTSAAAAATVVSSGQTIVFNTTTAAYTIDAGPAISGTIDNGAARFDFDGIDIQNGATVTVIGIRGLLIVSNGDIIVNTLIDVSGKGTVLGAAGLGGPAGGSNGGVRAVNPGSTTANGKGFGPGGGGSGCALTATPGGSTGSNRAGGGGAYGGNGGINSRAYRAGGTADTYGGVAASAYGTPQIYVLVGGSGGGGGKNYAASGGGGGAIGLTTTSGNITVGANGLIWSNGGDAATDFTGYSGTDYRYAGGGGSGGSIRLDAAGTVTISGGLSSYGGHGGCATTPATDNQEIMGGGGAGGRIAIYTASGTYTGTIPASAVAGGSGGHYIPVSAYVGGPGAAGTINTYTSPMVLPGQVTGPNPGNGATGIGIYSPALSWQAGHASATAWDVYFGTSSQSPPLLTNVVNPSTAAAGELNTSTQYFWRVDEHNTYGTVTGIVWAFTTRGVVCITPPVGDANGDCYVNFTDTAIMASEWLVCNRDPSSECWQ